MIEPPEDQRDTFVQCELGHQFCTRCKMMGWHKLGKCKLVSFLYVYNHRMKIHYGEGYKRMLTV
jgi:hypothetical protein